MLAEMLGENEPSDFQKEIEAYLQELYQDQAQEALV